MRKLLGLSSILLIGSLLQTTAATFDGSSDGIFQNPTGPVGAVYTEIGPSDITWGTPSIEGEPPNSLSFFGTTFAGVVPETTFSVGALSYYNGSILAGTEIDTVELALTLSFTSPFTGDQTFVYPLTITSTPNVEGDPEASADYITLPAFSSSTFSHDGVDYTLQVGFGEFTGGGFIAPDGTFRVYEGSGARAPVVGKITENIPGVPEVSSTLLLMGIALGSLGIIRKRS